MPTFLQLCKYTCRECGVAGGESAISAVANQTGELGRIVGYVANAWTEIQNRSPNWRWMRHGFTVNTVEDDDTYAYTDCTDTTASAVISRFSRWRLNDRNDPPKIYLTSAGVGTQNWMIWVPWESFSLIYRIGTQNSGYPVHITANPQDNIVIGPKPNGIYTVTSDYQRSAQILDEDADVPEMPTQFHMLIVYEAMRSYGYFESAPEVLAKGTEYGDRMMSDLRVNQLPGFRLGGPMA